LKKNHRIFVNLAQIFLRQLATKQLFKFPPHPMSVPALPGETRTSKILHFYILPNAVLLLNRINAQNIFCSNFWHFGWYFI